MLFDLDDTLFDHTRALTEGLRELRASESALRRRSFPEIVREYERLLDAVQPGPPPAPATHGEARARRFGLLARWLDGPVDRATAERWSAEYRAAYQSHRFPVVGTNALLRRLYGRVVLGIVTNNHTDEQEEKLRVLGLERWFDFMITSESSGLSKPDPRIFRLALDRAVVSEREAVMVGDSWAADVEGALGAGMSAVWLNRRGLQRRIPRSVRSIASFRPTGAAATVLLEGRAP